MYVCIVIIYFYFFILPDKDQYIIIICILNINAVFLFSDYWNRHFPFIDR